MNTYYNDQLLEAMVAWGLISMQERLQLTQTDEHNRYIWLVSDKQPVRSDWQPKWQGLTNPKFFYWL